MTVERHLVGAGRLGDRIDADASDPVLVEQVPGGAGDPIARTGPAHDALLIQPGSSCRRKFVRHGY